MRIKFYVGLFLFCLAACSVCMAAGDVLTIKAEEPYPATYTVTVNVGIDQQGHVQFKADGIGFDGLRIEQISMGSNPEILTACTADSIDNTKQNYKMNVLLPADTPKDQPVKMRLIDIGKSSIVMNIIFTPSQGSKEYVLTVTTPQGRPPFRNCGPGCWYASMSNPKSRCEAGGCCRNGGVTYNFDRCEIICENGDC